MKIGAQGRIALVATGDVEIAGRAWYGRTGDDMADELQNNAGRPILVVTGLRRCFCRAALAWALILAAPAWAANTFNSVYISEFLAESRHAALDGDGDHSGWIELYNGGSDVVDLAGWFLSDTPTDLTKWCFPEVGILPGNYLV